MLKIENIIKENLLTKDSNGIYYNPKLSFKNKNSSDLKVSQNAWSKIYNFNLDNLKKDIKEFNRTKLEDVTKYLEQSYSFSSESVYLEIGCGPSYIGSYLLSKYNIYFIGIDFNYEMLLTLKKYFEEKGYSKFILIYDDINNMPLKDNTVDFIYGGGVIEHFKDTDHILKQSYRILKPEGVSFNTVPAFNLWWILRFYNNIPDLKILRNILEFIHLDLLKGKVLEKYFGYELSFTINRLKYLHQKNNFKKIFVSSFAIHPSLKKSIHPILDKLYFYLQKNVFTGAIYQVYGKK